MTNSLIRTSGLLALALPLLAGCPGPEEMDTGGTDTGPGRDTPGIDTPGADVPGLDAPGADVPGADVPGLDAPVADVPMTADTPVGACLTGYPALGNSLFAMGLSRPIYMTGAPGTTDLFVVEQAGRIRVLDSTGAAAGMFLDIRTAVEDGSNEQGLLGLAFAPDYATSGVFYVFYTDASSSTGGEADNVVARGTRMSARVANPTVEVILRIPDFAGNHNGGCIQFGPDGELYIGTGDGGGGGDPRDYGQNINELLGKMLRIHVESTGAYTSPAGNPFVGMAGDDEIFAIGLRNPWRFSFDRATGDMYIGDVGQGAWEEIDYLAAGTGAGANFGWNTCEGFRSYPGGGDCSFTHDEPLVTQSHGSDPVIGRSSFSITGGYVYRGSDIPGLVGAYLFGDYVGGYVAAFRYCDGMVREYQRLMDLDDTCNGLASFAQDNDGELYMVCRDGGNIRRIDPG